MASISKRVSGEWQNTSYGIRATATDTITTLPTIIYGDGTNATIDIKGNTTQSGTPTPENPVMPQGCGNKTANLSPVGSFSITAHDTSQRIDIFSGTLEAGSYIVALNQDNAITGSTRNTLQVTINGTTYYNSSNTNYHNQSGQQKMSFTVSETSDVAVKYWANDLNENCTYSNVTFNAGSEVVNEPYGYKIPISSGDTTTNIYLGEVETTRRIKKLVLTGEETWVKSSSRDGAFYCLWSNLGGIQYYQFYCDRCEWVSDIDNYVYGTCFSDTALNLWLGNAGWTVTNFKSYLAQQYAAGTPVCVWYVLATETTGIVNEPLMKIDSYADEVNDISIPTIDGANTLAIDTTVQPSEVSVNYHGWHMGAVHERVSGEWD